MSIKGTKAVRTVNQKGYAFEVGSKKLIDLNQYYEITVLCADGDEDKKYYPVSRFDNIEKYADWYKSNAEAYILDEAHERMILMTALSDEAYKGFIELLTTVQNCQWDKESLSQTEIIMMKWISKEMKR